MAIILKIVTFICGMVALIVGFSMLLFFDKFMAFNNYINKNFMVGKIYDQNAFGVDKWIFTKSYLFAIILIIAGIYILGSFLVFAPY